MTYLERSDHDALRKAERKLAKHACRTCGEIRTLCECLRFCLTDRQHISTIDRVATTTTRRRN